MIDVVSHLDAVEDRTLADDVRAGLRGTPKAIPPKHFYDARGSELFEAICALPEYYPTRAEREILEARAGEIAARSGARELVELGSGAADKARVLLAGGGYRRYVPVDVSESALRDAAAALHAERPFLRIDGVVADFERHLHRIPDPRPGRPRLVAFLGGTVGNFTPGPRRALLRGIAGLLRPGDHLLLGTDLVKDPAVLVAAYDDSAGVTAEFNRNVLRVIDRELGADFDAPTWMHEARWNAEEERIEMWLRTPEARTVRVARLDLDVWFDAGEAIHTENSSKFTRARLDADLAAAGLAVDAWFTDEAGRYALSLASRR